MPNIGEEICGEYLKHILKCDFVSYNITNPDIQGEIDVIGIQLEQKAIYVCEVVTHTQGLEYVTKGKSNDYNVLKAKYDKGVAYAQKYFKDYQIRLMLWSPIVRINTPKAKYNTMNELKRLKEDLPLDIEFVINFQYQQALDKLKAHAIKQTAMFTTPVMRMFQIEGNLQNHLEKLHKKGIQG